MLDGLDGLDGLDLLDRLDRLDRLDGLDILEIFFVGDGAVGECYESGVGTDDGFECYGVRKAEEFSSEEGVLIAEVVDIIFVAACEDEKRLRVLLCCRDYVL